MWMIGRSSPRVATTRKRIACYSEKNRFSRITLKSTNGKRSTSQRGNSNHGSSCAYKTGHQSAPADIERSSRGRSAAVAGRESGRRQPSGSGATVTAGVIKENHGKVKSSSRLNKNHSPFIAKNNSSNKYAMVDRDSLTSPQPGTVGGRVSQAGPSSTNANVYIADDSRNCNQQQQLTTVLPTATDSGQCDRNGNMAAPSVAAATSRLTNDPSVPTIPSNRTSSALCDIENNNTVALASTDTSASVLATEEAVSTSSLVKKTKKKSRKDKGEEGSSSTKKSKSSEHKKRRSKVAQTDYCKIERPEAEGAEGRIEFDDDPDAAEWAKLRCTSDSTEVVAEREARRQRRCADYPGLAFGGSIFGTDTMMKFNIIRNELHNIMKNQLKRVTFFHTISH